MKHFNITATATAVAKFKKPQPQPRLLKNAITALQPQPRLCKNSQPNPSLNSFLFDVITYAIAYMKNDLIV